MGIIYTASDVGKALKWHQSHSPRKKKIWLVWKIRLPDGESALRAVTDTKELAIIYAENTKRDEHSPESKFLVSIEESDLNHHFAGKMMKNLKAWDASIWDEERSI